jgi:putative serine protease PepD
VGSGVLGGWVALQNDNTTTTSAASNTTISNPPPVINRADLASVASAVQASVVTIITGSGEGSGVVYDNSGHIVTNNHVVATATGNTVQVNFNNGSKAQATIVGTDPKSDLAVIKVANASGMKVAKFGDSGSMRVGDTVLAIGSPLDLEGTVTAGIVSALDRTIQVGSDQQQQQDPFSQQQQSTATSSISGLMQTDAPINPGNSGGALVNTKGEVIGINSAIATSGSSTGNIGVGFAIPSNKVKAVADQLIRGGKVSHPFLGVSVGNGQGGGALVQSVTASSPAAKVGLQQGDVITKIGNKSVNTSDDVVSAVQSANVGDKLDITYTRNGQQKTATVTLAEAS